MTATCTLCGTILSVEPDGLLDSMRDDRTFGALGTLFKKHMERFHVHEPQRVLDPSDLPGNLGQFFVGMGFTAQACIMFSFLSSEEDAFQKRVLKMREMIQLAIAQKQMPQVVQPRA